MQGLIGIELVNKATDYVVRLGFYKHLLGELYLSPEADKTIFNGDINARVGDIADCRGDRGTTG